MSSILSLLPLLLPPRCRVRRRRRFPSPPCSGCQLIEQQIRSGLAVLSVAIRARHHTCVADAQPHAVAHAHLRHIVPALKAQRTAQPRSHILDKAAHLRRPEGNVRLRAGKRGSRIASIVAPMWCTALRSVYSRSAASATPCHGDCRSVIAGFVARRDADEATEATGCLGDARAVWAHTAE